MSDLCLLTVHAHPDDEASKGAGTVARYHHEGIHTVLVCCTGGEAGDILNPEMDTPEVRANLPEVRRSELATATTIIGYDEVVMLGYRDSGMPGTPENQDPRCFARADIDEAVGRLVAEIRRARPQVIVTYDEDHSGYPHPDHIRVHQISVEAWEAVADPTRYPNAGEPFQPSKLYYTVWSRTRIIAMHDKFIELGLESPYDEHWFSRPWREGTVTTSIDVTDYYDARVAALKAHRTQIDGNSKFWFGLPDQVAKTVHPFDEYVLARVAGRGAAACRAGETAPAEIETDLFAGLR